MNLFSLYRVTKHRWGGKFKRNVNLDVTPSHSHNNRKQTRIASFYPRRVLLTCLSVSLFFLTARYHRAEPRRWEPRVASDKQGAEEGGISPQPRSGGALSLSTGGRRGRFKEGPHCLFISPFEFYYLVPSLRSPAVSSSFSYARDTKKGGGRPPRKGDSTESAAR